MVKTAQADAERRLQDTMARLHKLERDHANLVRENNRLITEKDSESAENVRMTSLLADWVKTKSAEDQRAQRVQHRGATASSPCRSIGSRLNYSNSDAALTKVRRGPMNAMEFLTGVQSDCGVFMEPIVVAPVAVKGRSPSSSPNRSFATPSSSPMPSRQRSHPVTTAAVPAQIGSPRREISQPALPPTHSLLRRELSAPCLLPTQSLPGSAALPGPPRPCASSNGSGIVASPCAGKPTSLLRLPVSSPVATQRVFR